VRSLKEAREKGKLAEFIKEREAAASGDADALNRGIASMAGKSKATPGASKPGRSGG